MTAFEVVLLLCGIVCVVVSFIMGNSEKDNASSDIITSKLTEEQKSEIRRQINEIVEEEVQNASEKTEVSLDRISNTKILEMNEYAENVLGQINRNHNETVFLYDMLNDKAKEVKTTVKDVNTTKRQVERIQAEVAAIDSNMKAVAPPADNSASSQSSPLQPANIQQSVNEASSASSFSAENKSFGSGTARTAKSDRPVKAVKPDKSNKVVKEKEFRVMTPDIVKEIDSDSDTSGSSTQPETKQAAKTTQTKPSESKAAESKKPKESKTPEPKTESTKASEPRTEGTKASEPKAESTKAEGTKAEGTKAAPAKASSKASQAKADDSAKEEDTNSSETKASAAKTSPKKRQPAKKTADSAESDPQAASSGNIAKERLRRVVAKDDENASAEEKDQERILSEEDRMDAAIMKAGGTSDKPAKTKTAAKKTAKKTQAVKPEPPKEVADMNIQFESGSNNNETILKMYKSGKNNKEIAKELNLGVGEVKLVIDLYNSTK